MDKLKAEDYTALPVTDIRHTVDTINHNRHIINMMDWAAQKKKQRRMS